MTQGSSIDRGVIDQIRAAAEGKKRVLVCLDSMRTRDHVLAELVAYSPLASVVRYCVVFDTLIEDMPPDAYPDRPWRPGDNPKTAVHEYLRRLDATPTPGADETALKFEIDKRVDRKLLITVAPDGYLKRLG